MMETVDYGPYWLRNPEARHHGAPVTFRLHNNGVMSYVVGDARLARLQRMVLMHSNRRLYRLMRMLNGKCREHGLGEYVCEDAARLARLLYSLAARHGWPYSNASLVAAAVYWACMRNGVGCSLDGGERRAAHRILWNVARTLGVSIAFNNRPLIAQHVTRLARALGLPPLVEYYAMRLYAIYKHRLQGPRPSSTAAALVYLAAKLLDHYVTQQQLAKLVGVTDATIRNTVAKMAPQVEYYVNGVRLMEWHPGKDSFGIRRPYEVASALGYPRYTFTITLPKQPDQPIIVSIKGER